MLLLTCLSCLSFFIYKNDRQKREIKDDLIELSNIKYGLFNVDEWKKILSTVLAKKIEEFELKGNDRKEMKKKITAFLYKVLDDFESRYYGENEGSITGFFKNMGARTFNVFGEMKDDVPLFSNQILDFLNDPKNKKALKGYLTDKLNEYADGTFAKMDYSVHDSIISKYQQPDRTSTITLLNKKLSDFQARSNNLKYMLALLALLTAVYTLLIKSIRKSEFILLTAMCSLFLIVGLTLPMIEIDARVSEITLSLLGEHVRFEDQVLYYKSKSILEVVHLMITQNSFDILAVGLLVLVFSVLFPLSKLISSVILTTLPQKKENKILSFLVYKTGKWSMADVMVVAIFMSYVGFSGILTEQLGQIEHLSAKIDVLTTNKSSLQTGFFSFASFTLLSLLLTNKLKNINRNPND